MIRRTMTHREVASRDHAAAVGENGQLIDVREPSEVATDSLPGAVNIPLGELPNRLHEIDPTRPVILLCRSGARSRRAAEYLVAHGFTDVVNLTGGLLSLQPHD